MEKKYKTTKKMNTNSKTAEMKDRKVILSTLWIFAVLNYSYADVFGGKYPEALKQLIPRTVGTLQMKQGFLLVSAILMETSIAMVLLSRVLKYRANRWANIIAGIINTAFVS